MNKMGRIAIAAVAAAALGAPTAMAGPAPRATTPVIAFGGTQVSNGIFFPGTVLCAGATCTGKELPLEVPQGNDVQFINLDVDAFAGAHQIQSIKRNKRTGRSLFQSELVAGPGQTVMTTSHLKPGVYMYRCTIHFGMLGVLEIQ
ncbi:MAG TPA: plastocyanin/azurin family copper-binding protein [Actinomycetota bacterium]|nr:plastocyanin/azurin family copper-binding protein [Actinomycetota bacterium]